MKIAPYAVLACLLTPSAVAESPTTTQRSLEAAPLLDLATQHGEVHIEGWDRSTVSFRAEHPSSVVIEVKRNDERIEVRQHRSRPPSLQSGVVYRIQVPRRTALRVATIDSPVSVRGLTAPIEILTDRGAIHAQEVEGAVHADTTAAEITLSSILGDVWLDATSGRLSLHDVTGDLTAQTERGPVSATGIRAGRLSISTGSGDVAITGAPTPGGAWKLTSLTGDLEVSLPSGLSASVTAGTLSGELHSDFGTGQSLPAPGESFTFEIGDGGISTLTLVTEQGSIRLLRR